jgi:hypothetical protein
MKYIKRLGFLIYLVFVYAIPTYILFSKVSWESGFKFQFKFWVFIALIIWFCIFFGKIKKATKSLPFGFWKITLDTANFLFAILEIWLFFEIMERAFIGGGNTLFNILIYVTIGSLARIIDFVFNTKEITYNFYKLRLKEKYDLEEADKRYRLENDL